MKCFFYFSKMNILATILIIVIIKFNSMFNFNSKFTPNSTSFLFIHF